MAAATMLIVMVSLTFTLKKDKPKIRAAGIMADQ